MIEEESKPKEKRKKVSLKDTSYDLYPKSTNKILSKKQK